MAVRIEAATAQIARPAPAAHAKGIETPGSVFACEPIGKTALDLGIITSLDVLHTAIVEAANQSEALLYALDYLLHSGFRSSHDRVEQAMTGNGGIESRANRFAISNAFRQSCVELSDIVTRVGRNPLRHPAIFLWD
jgi:hypothetical protein